MVRLQFKHHGAYRIPDRRCAGVVRSTRLDAYDRDDTQQQKGQAEMTAEDSTAPRKRVVIAEDEALIRMDLAEMLGEEGYEVVGQAGDGAEAVKLAEVLRPDLVILDVKMPVLEDRKSVV